MNKLDKQGDSYRITHRKEFATVQTTEEQLLQAIDFAYQMIYGKGHHRSHRTGGKISRKRGEKFCNTFQGKLAEIVLVDL
ncbi:hypothetical protein [Sphingobacterium hungaricum]|uniref:Uncharacterized protein n=1 Tax=Sphingobacterium hungaricum TaxID=2082723 RepID=A0A928V032_9SPHI|nr:hypothetical protein [Sphingobacterium hungaricum]MBE8715263.1 hypothetical protein [Sphingobacterium hungaricum]